MAKIVFSGGGTLGPVTPLLAVASAYHEKYPDTEFVWVGTKNGPEKALVEKSNIRFITLPAGKWRRYFSLWNIFDIFRFAAGFLQAIVFIIREKPALLVSAGGYVSVPLHFAGAMLGVKTWIHQQDYQVGLANRLMSQTADLITVALKKNLSSFNLNKTVWLGNPVRGELFLGDKQRAKEFFGIKSDLPVVLAMGGGTGSLKVNQLVVEAISHLRGICEVIHLSGKERPQELVDHAAKFFDHYHHYQFLNTEMADAYAIADIVISRGGFGSISEIAALHKSAILIPKPGHQFENVKFIADDHAAIFVDERIADGLYLAKIIKELLANDIEKRHLTNRLSNLMPPAEKAEIVGLIDQLLK
jgi:UDP-N-acetylglucosamine--N-acetylmuramyl-(pentapeptide) pyrophosphoryl-undecaprenol N-acetylglucosamine transferase